MALFDAPKQVVRAQSVRTGCAACTLSSEWHALKNPRLTQDLPDDRKPVVYFVGEVPSEADDEAGVVFSGDSGKLLKRAISRWDPQVTTAFSNVIRCHTPSGRSALAGEISACWGGFGLLDLLEARPRVIVPLGNAALQRFFPGNISEWNGVAVPHKLSADLTSWVFPLYHPSYLITQRKERDRGESDLQKIWQRSLDYINKLLVTQCPPEVPNEDEIKARIEVVLPPELGKIRGLLIKQGLVGPLTVDIETSCLMPWEDGARILSVSVTNDSDLTVTWLLDHPENPYVALAFEILFDILSRATDLLIAHNAIFEMRWLAVKYGLQAFGWPWADTMARPYAELGIIQGARSSENGIPGRLAGLGKQTRLHFGFDVKEVTKVDPLKWRTTAVPRLLLYNGLDSKWTHKLWHAPIDSVSNIEVQRQRGATRSAAAISWRGMCVDNEELGLQAAKLENNVRNMSQVLARNPEVLAWEIKYRTTFNPSSPEQVAKFFKLQAADEEALREVDTPLSKQILQLRKQEKLLGTYANGIRNATYSDGCLHPDFGTMLVATGRWASRKPNAQNMPVRENKDFRKVVVAPPGCALVSIDYAQLEARGIAIATHDNTMLGYVWKDEDIHKEWAVRLLDAFPAIGDRLCPNTTEDKIVVARVRGEIKNGLVFPAFYGAGIPKCAGELQVPEDTLGPIFEEFWRKYSGARKWQEATHGFYAEHLYVETMTRRRRYGPLSWTEQLNSPIQGTGSDIVVDASVQLIDLACETNDIHFVPMVNVHDDLSFYLPVKELDRYIQVIAKIMVTPRYTWCTVPLKVEVKIGHKNWSEQNVFRAYDTGDFHALPKTGLANQIRALADIARTAAATPTRSGRAGGSSGTHATTRRDPNAARRERIALKQAGLSRVPLR